MTDRRRTWPDDMPTGMMITVDTDALGPHVEVVTMLGRGGWTCAVRVNGTPVDVHGNEPVSCSADDAARRALRIAAALGSGSRGRDAGDELTIKPITITEFDG